MPNSYGFFDKDICALVAKLSPKRILDVGPGAGKWGVLLKDPSRVVDAVEIFFPYVSHFGLTLLYNHIFVGDILQFPLKKRQYDLAILGDVLEHLSVENAQKLLGTFRKNHIPVLITVPYLYPHPAAYGNPWEEHLQPDLTEEIFNERYPGFKLLYGNEQQGIYFREALRALSPVS